MLSMFFTALAIFRKDEFFFLLHFIFHRDVVLAFTDLTDKSNKNAFFFFGHVGIIYKKELGINLVLYLCFYGRPLRNPWTNFLASSSRWSDAVLIFMSNVKQIPI